MSINYIWLLIFVFLGSFFVAEFVSFILQKISPRYSKLIINHNDGTTTEYIIDKSRMKEVGRLIKQEHKRQFEENKKIFAEARKQTAEIKQKIRNNCRNVV